MDVKKKSMRPMELKEGGVKTIPIQFDVTSKNIGNRDAFTIVGLALLDGVTVTPLDSKEARDIYGQPLQ